MSRFATCLLALIALLPFAGHAESPSAHRPIVIGYVMDGATLPHIYAYTNWMRDLTPSISLAYQTMSLYYTCTARKCGGYSSNHN